MLAYRTECSSSTEGYPDIFASRRALSLKQILEQKPGQSLSTFGVVKPCKEKEADSVRPFPDDKFPSTFPQASRKLGIISVAEWFKRICEGAMQGRSDLLNRVYLLSDPLFP